MLGSVDEEIGRFKPCQSARATRFVFRLFYDNLS